MSAQLGGLIDQLETALGSKDLARRAEVLRRVTDLFVLQSGSFSDDQIELFDIVMGKLIDNIESAARAQFGSRIAKLPDAPRGVVRVLAQDAAIEVAGPLLTYSERLDVDTLVDTARTRSQDHLLAISTRKVLVEAVTDVLVDRGNSAVVSSTAQNAGAKFSEFGMSMLVRKARRRRRPGSCASGRARIFRGKTWSSYSSMPLRRSRTSWWKPIRAAPN